MNRHSDNGETLRLTEKDCKILLAMLDLSTSGPTLLRYEDIVVAAFRRFPEDFQLRGYPEYPDASDVHKKLYQKLKQRGVIAAGGNKRFKLTAHGYEVAKQVAAGNYQFEREDAAPRLTRDVEAEARRLLTTDAYRLFDSERLSSIVDTDFYGFYRVSVRTPRNDFIGRLNTVANAVRQAAASGQLEFARLPEVDKFLREKFRDIVAVKSGVEVS